MVPFFLYSSHPDPDAAPAPPGQRQSGPRASASFASGKWERTRDVAAHDGLDGQDGQTLHEHDAALELIAVALDDGGHLVDVGRDDMVADHVLEQLEPEEAELRQDLALSWHALHNGRASDHDAGRSQEAGRS